MADTPESIEEIGIPKIVMKLSPLESIPTAVDATLSNVGEAAEAAAVGEALAELDEKIDSKTAETLYMDDTQSPTNTIAAKIEDITTALEEIAASAVAYGEGTVEDALDAIDQDITDIKNDLYATEIPVSTTDTTPISEKLSTLQTGVDEAVKVSAQELTTAQKQQARANIGAIGEDGVSDVVRNTAQTMTAAQQEIARTNIGAAADDAVLKKETQSLTAEIQGIARSNIGALGESDAVLTRTQTLTTETQGIVRTNIGAANASEAVSVNSQSFTDAQKTQARTNIGAAADEAVVKHSAQTLTAEQQAQARANIGLGSMFLVVNYSADFEIEGSGYTNVTKEDFEITDIEGYTIMGIRRAWTSKVSVWIGRFSSAGTVVASQNTIVTLRNVSTSAQTGSVGVALVWVRSELISLP